MKNMNTTELSLPEHNRLAAEKILPKFKDFGLHYLADREAILQWAQAHWRADYQDSALPKTLTWAAGIENCSHLRIKGGDFVGSWDGGTPGLFSLSENGSLLEWRPGMQRPIRIMSQPVKTTMQFLNFVTRNNNAPEAPVFVDLFEPYSEDFCNSWTLDRARVPSCGV